MRVNRLSRKGVVRQLHGGCMAVAVSVPCDTCGACPAAQDREARTFPLEQPGAALAAGQAVEVSVSAPGLTRLCARLFLPGLVVAVGFGAFVEPGAGTAICGAGALVVALMLGRQLARTGLEELDLRVGSGACRSLGEVQQAARGGAVWPQIEHLEIAES